MGGWLRNTTSVVCVVVTSPSPPVHRAALHGGRPRHDPVQTQAAAAQVGHSGEAGEDAARRSGGHQTAGGSSEGAVEVV